MERSKSFCKFGTLFVGRNERWNTHYADDFDEYDGISADCIMQYAIFGDVIYG